MAVSTYHRHSLSFFFALSLSFFALIAGDRSSPVNCTNRRIHIRRLPAKFNSELLAECSAGEMCPYISNHGLGPKTHRLSQSWYRTDPLSLEILFHRRMADYPCLAGDPADADAVFLPYYAAIDAAKYLYGTQANFSAEHGLDLYAFLRRDDPATWHRRLGHDHFLVMARPAWDFSQAPEADPVLWGTSFLERPEFFNVTAMTVEARAWPWQEVAVPYATSFHPPTLALLRSWQGRVRRSRRTTLALFVGGGGSNPNAPPNIRRSIRAECENASDSDVPYGYSGLCAVVDCSNGVCEHDPIRFMKPMLQASFCLQPPGDTPTRRSTFDSLIAGCIPVFFEDQSAKSQYLWHLPEIDELSVMIPKEEVVFKGARILDVLRAIPRAAVRRMRERVVEAIPRVMYRHHGSSDGLSSTTKDAFDIAIDGVLERIRNRLEEVGLK